MRSKQTSQDATGARSPLEQYAQRLRMELEVVEVELELLRRPPAAAPSSPETRTRERSA